MCDAMARIGGKCKCESHFRLRQRGLVYYDNGFAVRLYFEQMFVSVETPVDTKSRAERNYQVHSVGSNNLDNWTTLGL